MQLLITGSAGYIGSHVVHDLIAECYDITVVDNLSSRYESNLPTGVKFVQGEIKDSNLSDLFDGKKFEVPFHFASKKDEGESMTLPENIASKKLAGV